MESNKEVVMEINKVFDVQSNWIAVYEDPEEEIREWDL